MNIFVSCDIIYIILLWRCLVIEYQKLYDFIDTQQSEMLSSLDRIVSIPSVKGDALEGMPYGENCAEVLNSFLSIADSMGFVTHNFENYVGTIKFNGTKESLGILCHLDVVPVVEKGWKYPPFKATLDDGKVFGRGTIDDKGPAIAVLYAMKSIKDMGIRLKSNVRFIVGTDEENGSSDLEYYSKCESMPLNVFTPDGSYPCINLEKGMIRVSFNCKYQGDFIKELQGGTVINGVPAECYAVVSSEVPQTENIIIEKVSNGYKVKYTGLSAHASTPQLGDNAITGLIEYLSKFDSSQAIQSLYNMFPHGDYNGKSLGIFAEDELSGSVTSVLSMISMQDGVIHCKQDVRFPICTTKENIIDTLKMRMEGYGYTCDILMAENPHHVNEDSHFIKTLLKIYQEETGNEPYCQAIGGGTYVHNIDGGVAFGAEFPNEDNGMHGDNESIRLDSLILNCKMFARAIIDICGVEE
ncbi:MAG: Sapep family Mn(2+)-dependent dipeptidase [Ruminococcus sp.]|nr:Sapep family Mn(2+)-dependent dipeptidase [Ruminococcus sp.]